MTIHLNQRPCKHHTGARVDLLLETRVKKHSWSWSILQKKKKKKKTSIETIYLQIFNTISVSSILGKPNNRELKLRPFPLTPWDPVSGKTLCVSEWILFPSQ